MKRDVEEKGEGRDVRICRMRAAFNSYNSSYVSSQGVYTFWDAYRCSNNKKLGMLTYCTEMVVPC